MNQDFSKIKKINRMVKNMKKLFIIYLLFSCGLLKGQDTVTYRFINEEMIENPNFNELYCRTWSIVEFSYKQIYIKNNLFIESPVLLLSCYKPDTFKIENDCWYIKQAGEEWQLFYSPDETIIPKLKYFVGSDEDMWWFYLKKIDEQILFGYQCYIYELEPIPKIIQKVIRVRIPPKNKRKKITIDMERELLLGGYYEQYWFNPQLGIIKIDLHVGAVIREDIVTQQKRKKRDLIVKYIFIK